MAMHCDLLRGVALLAAVRPLSAFVEPFHQTLESSGGALDDSAGDLGLQARFSLAVPEQMAQQQLTAGGAGQLLTVSARLQPHGTGLLSSDLDLQSSDSDLQSF